MKNVQLEKHMPILAGYLRCIRRNSRKYRIFSAGIAAAAAAGIAAFLIINGISADASVLCAAVVFISLFLTLLPLPPFYSSLFWQHRTLLFVLLGAVQWMLSARIIETAFSMESKTPNYPIWCLIWLIVPAAVGIFRKLNNFCVRQIANETKIGKTVQQVRLTALRYALHWKYEKKQNIKRTPLSAVCFLLVSGISILFIGLALFLHNRFTNMGVDAILFTIRFSDNANQEIVRTVWLIAVILVIASVFLTAYYVRKKNAAFCVAQSLDRSRTERIEMPPKTGRNLWAMVFLSFSIGLLSFVFVTNLADFIISYMSDSNVYEEYYINPASDIVHFPQNKKNLIFVYMESMENTFTSNENGGDYDTDYIPEIVELERSNTNFSHTSGIGGATVFPSPFSYTMGSTVGHTSGVPLLMVLTKNAEAENSSELPGLRRLENILHDEGYNQLFLIGSDSHFAGYETFAGRFDDSRIFDRNTAKEEGYVENEMETEWGLLDSTVFDISKDKLTKLAEQEKPFCLTLYTMDTHGQENGVRCPLCDPAIENDLAAAVRCASKQIDAFVKWLQEQAFYENTVLILVGDHPMETLGGDGFLNKESFYKRNTVCCIINSDKTPVNEKKRIFSAADMFPTTLSAIGVQIDGNRLGFGTDLFSEMPTLCEEMGVTAFEELITANSKYYLDKFWQIYN